MITLSLQTKLGEKVGILFDRTLELWHGKSEKPGQKKGTVKVSQPIAGQQPNQLIVNPAVSIGQSAMNQSIYTDGTSIGSLPMNNQFGNGVGGVQSGQMQQQIAQPMMEVFPEPLSSNSFGGGFGSW
jgi:hypothetical protein